ncbi:MAG: formylglycine-generating enzyme family protein [Bacteroidota bacterium]
MSKTLSLALFIVLFSCGRATPDEKEPVSDEVPANMVLIEGGAYRMGGRSEQAYQDEFPRHEVEISPFYMDKYEVTNRDFVQFVESTGYITVAEKDISWEEIVDQLPAGTPKPADSLLQAGSLIFQQTKEPVDLADYSQWWKWTIGANWRNPTGSGCSIEELLDHPVVHIAWEDAVAYAEWAGKRLPTEAEWEWAASGGNDSQKYPWGDTSVEAAVSLANFWQGTFPAINLESDGFFGTAPVGSFPPNTFGLYDMAGNVWEWCQDKYDFNHYDSQLKEGKSTNPKGSKRYYDPREPYSSKHVIRGGSFLCNDSYCSGYRVSRRMSSTKDSGFNHTGFRCVKDL